MPVLPLIDALILLGWSSLLGGFLLKAIYVTTAYRPTVFGFTPIDFLLIAVVCLLFALTLAARTWVRVNEPQLAARRRKRGLARYDYSDVVEEVEAVPVAGGAGESGRGAERSASHYGSSAD